MNYLDEPMTAVLNDLLTHCFDAERGFREAETHAHDSAVRALLVQLADQRLLMTSELERQIRALGQEPVHGGTVVGLLERSWMNFKAVIIGQGDAALLMACEHCEQSLCRHFEEALSQPWPADIATFLRGQYLLVEESLERLRSVERIHEHVA